MQTVVISTNHKRQIVDITDTIQEQLHGNGVATVFVQHSTAALTVADLDPGADQDFLDFLSSLVPDIAWRHPHDPAHAPDHLLASLIGPSVSLPYQGGEFRLGSWQRLILVELNGPRDRNVLVALGSSNA